MGLAVDYSNATRPPGEAMALVREAIELLRPLAEDLPGVHRSTLAQMLHNLAWEQSDAGDAAAARESIAEAVEHRRALTRQPYGTPVPALAQSVSALATYHASLRPPGGGGGIRGRPGDLRPYRNPAQRQ